MCGFDSFTFSMNLPLGKFVTCHVKSDRQHENQYFLFIAGQSNDNQKVYPLTTRVFQEESRPTQESPTNFYGPYVKQTHHHPKRKPVEKCQKDDHAIMLQDPNTCEEMTNKVYKHSNQTKSNIPDQSFITMPIEQEKKVADVNAKFAALVSWLNLGQISCNWQ